MELVAATRLYKFGDAEPESIEDIIKSSIRAIPLAKGIKCIESDDEWDVGYDVENWDEPDELGWRMRTTSLNGMLEKFNNLEEFIVRGGWQLHCLNRIRYVKICLGLYIDGRTVEERMSVLEMRRLLNLLERRYFALYPIQSREWLAVSASRNRSNGYQWRHMLQYDLRMAISHLRRM